MHLHANHHPLFIILSCVIAVFGSWTALDLFRRIRSHLGRARRLWLTAASVAMGLSIWSMHFVAMLGFDPGSAVRYDPLLTFVSLVLAIGATLVAFAVGGRDRADIRQLLAAGAFMGSGICLMHYVGMAALRSAVSLGYAPGFVMVSLVIAVGASVAALLAARLDHGPSVRLVAALTLGLAIVGMHYTAMAGLRLTPTAQSVPAGAPPVYLAVGVAAGTLLILFLALLASLYDQRGNILPALDAGGVGYWELDLKEERLRVSRRAKQIFGLRPDAPFTYGDLDELIAPEERERRAQLLASAVRSGGDYDAEFRLAGSDRFVNIRGKVLRDHRGRAMRMIGVVLDVTDRHAAFAAVSQSEGRQRLLINELNHRVKNSLATVQSIAAQTARRAVSVEAFRETFDARLVALSATHNALTRAGWESASLRELVEQELSPYAAAQITTDGPAVELAPGHALAFGMALHELATNAAKYGALSRPEGALSVRWVVEGGNLELWWREAGGPAVVSPTTRGFGSRLIEQSIVRQLGGHARFDFAPTGLQVRLAAPLAKAAPTAPLSL